MSNAHATKTKHDEGLDKLETIADDIIAADKEQEGDFSTILKHILDMRKVVHDLNIHLEEVYSKCNQYLTKNPDDVSEDSFHSAPQVFNERNHDDETDDDEPEFIL